MSIVKRILEANNFKKTLPEDWIDHAFRAHLKFRMEQMQKTIQSVRYNKPSQLKKTDENQLSLF